MSTHVDRNGRLPIYHQIALSIQQRIANHEWEVGSKLPSENDLATHYEVSRVTIRQALTELEKDKIVRRNRPSGTFVTRLPDKLAPTVSVLVDVLQSLGIAGHTSAITTLSMSLYEEDFPDARRVLQMPREEPFVQITRLITVNDASFAWVQTFAPSSRVPGLENLSLKNNSLQETIGEHFGIRALRAEHWIGASHASPEDVEILNVASDRLILDMSSIFYDQRDQPMAYMNTRLLADLMRLHLQSSSYQPLIDPPGKAT